MYRIIWRKSGQKQKLHTIWYSDQAHADRMAWSIMDGGDIVVDIEVK